MYSSKSGILFYIQILYCTVESQTIEPCTVQYYVAPATPFHLGSFIVLFFLSFGGPGQHVFCCVFCPFREDGIIDFQH